METKHQKFTLAVLVASTVLLMLLLTFTNPREVGLFGILAVIAAIYCFFVSAIYLFYGLFRKKADVKGRKVLYISCALAFAPVLLIILNSLGAVGIIELILIVLFEITAIFLITKRTQ